MKPLIPDLIKKENRLLLYGHIFQEAILRDDMVNKSNNEVNYFVGKKQVRLGNALRPNAARPIRAVRQGSSAANYELLKKILTDSVNLILNRTVIDTGNYLKHHKIATTKDLMTNRSMSVSSVSTVIDVMEKHNLRTVYLFNDTPDYTVSFEHRRQSIEGTRRKRTVTGRHYKDGVYKAAAKKAGRHFRQIQATYYTIKSSTTGSIIPVVKFTILREK